MKRIVLYAALPLLAAAAALTSCGRDAKIIGSWTASSPVSITAEIPAASTANSLLSIDFIKGQSSKEGTFIMSSLIEATQPVKPDSIINAGVPYEVSIAATASVKGTWRYDDDDVLLMFDMNSLDVNVDPSGVMFSQDILNGAQRPAVDSLSAVTAKVWKRQIATTFKTSLHRYAKLDDIEVVSDGTTLKFEVKDITGRDRDMILHRVIVSD